MGNIIDLADFLSQKQLSNTNLPDFQEITKVEIMETDLIVELLHERLNKSFESYDISTDILLSELSARIALFEKICILSSNDENN